MKATKVTIALAAAMAVTGLQGLQAQEPANKHEINVAFQGLGLGSMPFSGPETWSDNPGLSVGFNVGYTYWFNETLGLRAGARVNLLSYTQEIKNLDMPFSVQLQASSLGYPSGFGMTTVVLRGSADKVWESHTYAFLEVPVMMAFRFGRLSFDLGVAFAKAVYATGEYSYDAPACEVTALPDMGVTTMTPVPLTMTGETESTVNNKDLEKPFYFLLAGDVGYRFPVGEETTMTLGLYGRWAPVSHKTDNAKEAFDVQSDATFKMVQPSASALVEKMGYYEVGLNVALNFGIGAKQKKACSHDHEPVLTPNNDCCKEMASELAALKAACKKAEEELAALKAEQRKAEVERLKAEANREKAEAARDKAEAARDKAEVARQAAEKAARDKAAAEKQAAMAKAEADRMATEKAQRAKAEAQEKLEAIGATVYFKSSGTKAQFDEQTDDAIHAICEAMKADNTLKVTVFGHTDNKGSFKTNMKYGYKRARALKNYMVKLGAPAKNIKCESKGPKEPVADNKTKEGRALNRRATVELK